LVLVAKLAKLPTKTYKQAPLFTRDVKTTQGYWDAVVLTLRSVQLDVCRWEKVTAECRCKLAITGRGAKRCGQRLQQSFYPDTAQV